MMVQDDGYYKLLFSNAKVCKNDVENFVRADFSGYEADFPDGLSQLLSTDHEVRTVGLQLEKVGQVFHGPLETIFSTPLHKVHVLKIATN
jgi:hypothetical protein